MDFLKVFKSLALRSVIFRKICDCKYFVDLKLTLYLYIWGKMEKLFPDYFRTLLRQLQDSFKATLNPLQ